MAFDKLTKNYEFPFYLEIILFLLKIKKLWDVFYFNCAENANNKVNMDVNVELKSTKRNFVKNLNKFFLFARYIFFALIG